MLKVSGNHPCICESGEKYKKCCKGKLTKRQEEYIAYLQKSNLLKQKIIDELQNIIEKDEFDEYINLYLDILDKYDLEEDDKSGFMEWLLYHYSKFEDKTILKYISEQIEHNLDELQKEVLNGLLHSQQGIFEIISINKELWEIKVREIFLGKEYIITDRSMSMQLNVGDYIFSRISQIFSYTTLGDYGTLIPDLKKRYILDEIKSCFEEEKLENANLSYEEFMNTNFKEIMSCINSPPKMGAINGDEICFHTQELIIKTINIEDILNYYDKLDKFEIINVEIDDEGKELIEAEIVYVYDESDDVENSDVSMRNLISAINSEGEQIKIFGSYKIHKNILTITSPTTAQFNYLLELFEEHFNSEIIERKEVEINTYEDLLNGKNSNSKDKVHIYNQGRDDMKNEILEMYYKNWCEEKIEALGGITPKEALKTQEGRDALKNFNMFDKNKDFDSEKFIREYLDFKE